MLGLFESLRNKMKSLLWKWERKYQRDFFCCRIKTSFAICHHNWSFWRGHPACVSEKDWACFKEFLARSWYSCGTFRRPLNTFSWPTSLQPRPAATHQLASPVCETPQPPHTLRHLQPGAPSNFPYIFSTFRPWHSHKTNTYVLHLFNASQCSLPRTMLFLHFLSSIPTYSSNYEQNTLILSKGMSNTLFPSSSTIIPRHCMHNTPKGVTPNRVKYNFADFGSLWNVYCLLIPGQFTIRVS